MDMRVFITVMLSVVGGYWEGRGDRNAEKRFKCDLLSPGYSAAKTLMLKSGHWGFSPVLCSPAKLIQVCQRVGDCCDKGCSAEIDSPAASTEQNQFVSHVWTTQTWTNGTNRCERRRVLPEPVSPCLLDKKKSRSVEINPSLIRQQGEESLFSEQRHLGIAW